MTSWTDCINLQIHTMWSGTWPKGMIEPPRVLVDHELVLVARGCCQIDISGTSTALSALDFVIVSPGTVHHSNVLVGPCVQHCLHFDWTWTGQAFPRQLYGFVNGRLSTDPLRPTPGWVPSGILRGHAPRGTVAIAQRLQSYLGTDEEVLLRSTALELLLTIFPNPDSAKAPSRTSVLARQVKARLRDSFKTS